MHWARWALSLALVSAGNNKAARIAMMAMTTSSSIKVNPSIFQVAPESDRCDLDIFTFCMLFLDAVELSRHRLGNGIRRGCRAHKAVRALNVGGGQRRAF